MDTSQHLILKSHQGLGRLSNKLFNPFCVTWGEKIMNSSLLILHKYREISCDCQYLTNYPTESKYNSFKYTPYTNITTLRLSKMRFRPIDLPCFTRLLFFILPKWDLDFMTQFNNYYITVVFKRLKKIFDWIIKSHKSRCK